MDPAKIKSALEDITGEKDPTVKALKLASLCTTIFGEHGIRLVVVGGSAIELLTEGAYASGDIDLCVSEGRLPQLRQRQELMAQLGAQGGPRSWRVAGAFVDILGALESFARTPRRKLAAPYGVVELIPPEELFVERILISTYPGPYPPARDTARKLGALCLRGEIQVDWQEVKRLANLPGFRVWPDCKNMVNELCEELGLKNPFGSDE
jgi:hypothetical protein